MRLRAARLLYTGGMKQINMEVSATNVIAADYNFCPLDRTWYEREVESQSGTTFRFAKRTDHTGVLVQIDWAEFLTAQS